MLESPPDDIETDWSNVGDLKLVIEHGSSFRHAFKQRRAFQHVHDLLEPETIVLVTNLDRATRRVEDIDELCAALQKADSDMRCMFMLSKHANESHQLDSDEPESEQEDSADASLNGDDEADERSLRENDVWVDLCANADRAKTHIENAMLLVEESSFYGSSTEMLIRVLLEARLKEQSLLADFKEALSQLARKQSLKHAILFTRTSRAGSDNSLQRQQAWLSLMLPPELRVIHAEYAGVSGAAGTPIKDTLIRRKFKNTLVLFTSIDRLDRSTYGLDELADYVDENNVHLSGTVWPSDRLDVLQLAARDKAPHRSVFLLFPELKGLPDLF
ncbi:hypothetical protein OIV83_004117 [Microbotryomycetes sp. JL201]|nr:hypothetical protein OIV83_004117 [Microbotryomycetes sp. JL201]